MVSSFYRSKVGTVVLLLLCEVASHALGRSRVLSRGSSILARGKSGPADFIRGRSEQTQQNIQRSVSQRNLITTAVPTAQQIFRANGNKNALGDNFLAKSRLVAAPCNFRGMSTSSSHTPLIDQFLKDVDAHLVAKADKQAVFATAWLATDNVFVALLEKHYPEVLAKMHLLAIDTMHLFPETFVCAKEVEEKYGKQCLWYKPRDCETVDDFQQLYGNAEEMDSADYDFASKVEPFQRALTNLKKDILITGRRMDQGNARISLDTWEDAKQIFNPMAGWSWNDIITYCDQYGVPVNGKHNIVYRADHEIPVGERNAALLARPSPLKAIDLGKPFWRASDDEIHEKGKVSYVFKSFGDVHTTAPVQPNESERAGRFFQQGKTECGIHTRTTFKGQPHGGVLMDLCVRDKSKIQELVAQTDRVLELNERQACDVWSLIHGAFSPLTGFMNEDAYTGVVKDMRLPEKQLFGMPVTLDVKDKSYEKGQKVLLRYREKDVAVLEVESCFEPNKELEAQNCYGTTSEEHPTVAALFGPETGKFYLGGSIHGIEDGPNFGYPVKTPKEVRATLPEGKDVVAFQNRNPIHRAHFELLKRAQQDVKDSILLVHPTCGPTQPGDIDGFVRIDTYQALEEETKEDFPSFRWAYLPYSMKMAGPREAVQHMIIRKNFGATHFIIGRDMAGTKSTSTGKDFYGPFDAQNQGKAVSSELEVTVTDYGNMVYVDEETGYVPENEVPEGKSQQKLSGTEFRRRLKAGEEIPKWFSFDSVVNILREKGDDAFCK